MKEKLIKKLLMAVAIVLMFTGTAFAESLSWTHDGADGFVIYYTDGTNDYIYNVGNVTTCDVDLLNLTPGVEYTFYVTAWNSKGESGPSNTVTYTIEAFTPPENNLPVATQIPNTPTVLETL